MLDKCGCLVMCNILYVILGHVEYILKDYICTYINVIFGNTNLTNVDVWQLVMYMYVMLFINTGHIYNYEECLLKCECK